MKVDIKDYELMKDMAYDNREKFQMLHAKMLLIKEGESTLKEMYYDLVEKYQRKNQECERFESRADELKNTLVKVNEKINRIVEIDGETFFCYIDINAEEFFGKELSDKLLDFVLFVEEMEKENEKE